MTEIKKQWKIIDILNTTTAYFAGKKIPDPRLNAERLLSFLLHLERIQLYLQFDRILKEDEIIQYRILIDRRVKREPLQYIVGQTEFMGFSFQVNPEVLIPRPETEILVERTMALKSKFEQREVVIWDIGTGSGCIAVAVAKLWPESRIFATDISSESLQVAQKNAERHGVAGQINFLKHDVLKDRPLLDQNIDILVANPPYISVQGFANLEDEIRLYEPEIALTDYGDGLLFYNRIFQLVSEGLAVHCIMLELSGLNQDKILNLAKQLNYKHINIVRDYNDIIRVLEVII
jgi:release factor glutamine methyltransferase